MKWSATDRSDNMRGKGESDVGPGGEFSGGLASGGLMVFNPGVEQASVVCFVCLNIKQFRKLCKDKGKLIDQIQIELRKIDIWPPLTLLKEQFHMAQIYKGMYAQR